MSAPDKKLPVVEIFGPVIQGEGSMIGVKTHFLRLGGCDYRCSWCDTKYAVLPELVKLNSTMMTPGEIASKILDLPMANWITLSGGNPAMHKDVEIVIDILSPMGYGFTMETQGSIVPQWLNRLDHLTISPKPPTSGEETNWDQLTLMIKTYNKPCDLKIVVFDVDDYEYAKEVFKKYYGYGLSFYLQVGTELQSKDEMWSEKEYLQAQREQILGSLEGLWITACEDPDMNNVRVLPQLHTLVYGQKRGV